MTIKRFSIRDLLMRSWQKPNWLTLLLWPMSLVYRLAFSLRSYLYKCRILTSYTAPVPVIVVGNLSVGGTGKTPLVIHLVECLRALGYKPGVISRGYGGDASAYPIMLDQSTPVSISGDEPALIVRRTDVPMVVGPNRVADIKLLLEKSDVDVIVSDDGLQHLALNRDIEICLLDDTSPLLNQYLLPAGPMREPMGRLNNVDFIVRHRTSSLETLSVSPDEFSMWLEPSEPRCLVGESSSPFDMSESVHAIAGIGNPQRFFNTCSELGLKFIAHGFADHHDFSAVDLDFDDDLAVLMTEKDAVKCQAFADLKHWYLPVNAKLSEGFVETLSQQLKTH